MVVVHGEGIGNLSPTRWNLTATVRRSWRAFAFWRWWHKAFTFGLIEPVPVTFGRLHRRGLVFQSHSHRISLPGNFGYEKTQIGYSFPFGKLSPFADIPGSRRSLTFREVTVRLPCQAIRVAGRAGTCHVAGVGRRGIAKSSTTSDRPTGAAAGRPAVERRSGQPGSSRGSSIRTCVRIADARLPQERRTGRQEDETAGTREAIVPDVTSLELPGKP